MGVLDGVIGEVDFTFWASSPRFRLRERLRMRLIHKLSLSFYLFWNFKLPSG